VFVSSQKVKNMNKIRFHFVFFILLIYTQKLTAQDGLIGHYQNGQLFIQTKLKTSNNFKENILKDKAFEKFKIESIERAFKLNTSGLDRVYLIKFSNFTDTKEFIQLLETSNYFNYVEKVPLYTFDYTPNDIQSSQWNLTKIRAEKAWDIQKGSNKIIIAVVDDATDTAHQDLEPAIWRNKNEIRNNGIDDDGNGYIDDFIGWDVADNDNNPTPGGSLSHGTHCAGIAGAVTDNNTGIASIGFGCKLMIVKTGRLGYRNLFNPYAGIEYAIINKANVISMSWGGGGYSSTYQLIFNDAFSKGIVCVAAAGNSNTNFTHYPSGYNYVIAVGSTASGDGKSSFSNYGTWVDVMAPGSGIYSTLPNNTYGTYSGTSMACPLVSGLCGLMFSKNPNATPTEIENCLKGGCDNIDNLNTSYIGEMGAGRINAENSLKCLKAINADFTSNYIQICPGDTIQFSDLSKPIPLSIKWLFPGGIPSTSLISNPLIKYNTPGIYDVTLIVFGSISSDTLIRKNYVTIAKPKAVLSGNRTIALGGTTTIRLDFTGNAPFSFKISDGTTTTLINNILYTPYYYTVSPTQTKTFTLTAFSDKKCVGTFIGTSVVTVNSNFDCTNVLKYQANIGSTADEQGRCVTEDAQGNIIVSGFTKSYGNGDAFLTKFNKNGSIIWFKTYGGNSDDVVYGHIITKDNGYLLLGATKSYATNEEALVIKVDSSGAVQWSKTIAGSNGRTYFQRVIITLSGDYILGGSTSAYGAGLEDNYLVKISATGSIIWANSYGNSEFNAITGLASFPDGSIVYSSAYRDPNGELVLAKTDSMGSLLWSKRFGGANDDAAYDLTIGKDGNIYLVGAYRPNSFQDICATSFTPNGIIRFIKTYGGSNQESAFNIKPFENDIVILGYTQTYGNGGQDGLILRIDTAGKLLNSRTLGGSSDEYFNGFCTTSDGGIYAVGYTSSFTNGGQDIFLNKLNCKLEVGCNEKTITTSQNQNLLPTSITQSVSSGGSFTNRSITAVKRNLLPNFLCKTEAGSRSTCLKINKFTKINSNSTGINGQLDDADYFGQTVRNLGDFNGDGIEDLIVGSQLDDDGGGNQGAVYILLLDTNGSIKSRQKISATQGGFTGNLSGNNYFGSGVSRLTDLDGDGVNDIVVGQNYDNTGNARAGAVWIIFLNANGTVKSHQKIANGVGGFPNILDSDDIFGNDVSEIGDVNNDGITDIVVGAPYDDDGGTDRGAVYIICLNTNGTVKSYQKISSSIGNMSGLINDDAFGYSVSGSKDFNNDGYKDIVVGARKDDDGGTDRGAIWIIYLDASNKVKSTQKISSTKGNFLGSLDNTDYFGTGVEIIGDIDNDQIPDIAVSAPYDDDGGADRGASWLLMLNANGTVKSHLKISSTTQNVLKNQIDNDDLFGWRLSYLNDINKDGYKEIIIGAMRDDDGGTDRGAVYILNLADTCSVPVKPKICKLLPSFLINGVCVTDSIQFKDLSTDSLKNNIVKWEWNFGDGNKLQGTPTPKHLYSSIGNYTVKLVVSNSADNTCKDSISKVVKIDNIFNILSLPNDTICIGDSALVGVSTEFCGTLPFTYKWTPTSTMVNPNASNSVVFPTKSTYYSVVVTDKFGKKAYDTVFIKIDSNCCKSFAHFNLNETQLCLNDTAKITNVSKSKPGAIFDWTISPAASIASYSGATIPNITFSKAGVYSIRLILKDVCVNDTVIHMVYVKPKPIMSAGRDTLLCLDDTVQLGEDGIGRNTYTWVPTLGLNDAFISNPKAIFKSDIKYILKMLAEDGCIAYDTIDLKKIIEPKLFLGNDTSLCVKDSIQIKSNIVANTYLWSNGTKNNNIYLKNSGTYWLKTKVQCKQADTITINFLQPVNFSLGNDTTICDKNITEIKPNILTSGYGLLWDDNSTISPRTIAAKGKYWLRIKNSNCESFDTINVDFLKKPYVSLGNDTILCNDASIDLDATDINAKKYLWNDGITQAKRAVNKKGDYSVKLDNACGTFTDGIKIGMLYDPIPWLGKDTTICMGDTILLNASVPNTNFYKWNDNSSSPIKKVFEVGKYSVEVGNLCGNFDTFINVATKNCDCNIYMPNVFSP
jgi:PKD repeat protein